MTHPAPGHTGAQHTGQATGAAMSHRHAPGGHAATASPAPRARWLLPDDGIIDPIAIELAASGIRPVALTPVERRLAAARILAAGGRPSQIARRLRMGRHAAREIAAAITSGRQDSAA
jgi:hypothetical protein